MRRGGTFGGTPPEAMQGRQVPCHPSQDVFAFAHMVLVLIVKVECKFANMFASQVSVVVGWHELANSTVWTLNGG